jgi:periplasmic protein TonB
LWPSAQSGAMPSARASGLPSAMQVRRVSADIDRQETPDLAHRKPAVPAVVTMPARHTVAASTVVPVPAMPEVGRSATAPEAPDVVTIGPAQADFLPRSALTAAPRALETVLLDFPRFDGQLNSYIGEFELFIDEQGQVVFVEGRSTDLPPILTRAVREAFLPARFLPGEVDGHAVRSRLRIEVSFESQDQSG